MQRLYIGSNNGILTFPKWSIKYIWEGLPWPWSITNDQMGPQSGLRKTSIWIWMFSSQLYKVEIWWISSSWKLIEVVSLQNRSSQPVPTWTEPSTARELWPGSSESLSPGASLLLRGAKAPSPAPEPEAEEANKAETKNTSGSRTWSGLPGQERNNMRITCRISMDVMSDMMWHVTHNTYITLLKHTCASASVWRPESARAGIAWASASWRWWSEAGAVCFLNVQRSKIQMQWFDIHQSTNVLFSVNVISSCSDKNVPEWFKRMVSACAYSLSIWQHALHTLLWQNGIYHDISRHPWCKSPD